MHLASLQQLRLAQWLVKRLLMKSSGCQALVESPKAPPCFHWRFPHVRGLTIWLCAEGKPIWILALKVHQGQYWFDRLTEPQRPFRGESCLCCVERAQPNHARDVLNQAQSIGALRLEWKHFHPVEPLPFLGVDAWQAMRVASQYQVPKRLVKPYHLHPEANREYVVGNDCGWFSLAS